MLKTAFTIVFISIIQGSFSACPKGWAEFNNNCYWESNSASSFDLAQSICKNYGGELASINSVEERDFIEKMLEPRKHDMWFGLKQDDTDPAVWKWTDGSTPGPLDGSIVKWSCENRPNTGCNEGDPVGPCGFYKWSTLLWENNQCSWSKSFMCKRSKLIADMCEIPNWHQYAGKCYRGMEEVTDWNSARTKCNEMAGNLVILKDQNHIDAFNHLQLCIDYQLGVWIGLSDVDTETPNTLKWVDGTDGNSGGVKNWAPDQPPAEFPSGHKDNCVVSYAIDNHKWRVTSCGYGNKYMCEKPEGVCAEGWEDYGNGYCYLVVTVAEQQLTWKEAKDNCAAYGYTAILLKISSQAEQNIIRDNIFNRLRDAGTPKVRIGASDENVDNTFHWADGSSIGYSNWNDSWIERTPERQDCGFVPTTAENPDGKWGASYCFDKMPYICRINIHTSPNPVANKLEEKEEETPEQAADEYVCDAGWEKWNNECYMFDDSNLIYAEAKAKCEERGAQILTIRDSDEQAFISNRLRGQSWLGLLYSNSQWIWDDGTSTQPQFKNWGNNGQNEKETKTCCELQQSPPGQWWNAHCTESQFKFICRKPTYFNGTSAPTSPPPPTSPVHPECGVGWNYDQVTRRCFAIRVGSSVTWEQANQKCIEEEGGNLVSITGPNEQTYINALLSSTVGGAVHYWIGLNDRDLEKGWRWTDGSGVSYFNWNAGEPNNWSGEEWCVEISPNYDGRWNDHNCSSLSDGYICKKLAASDLTTTTAPGTDSPPQGCTDPQAMVSGSMYVQDQYIIASSQKEGSEAWKSRQISDTSSSWEPTESNTRQYIEVLFPFPRMVSKISLAGAPNKDSWVTQFEALYKVEEGSRWHYVYNSEGQVNIFEGNNAENKNGGVTRDLPEMLYAQAIRIVPRNWTAEISMRFDVHGCRWEEGLCHYWEIVNGETMSRDHHMTASGSKEGKGPSEAKMTKGGWEANEPYDGNQWLQVKFDSHLRVMEIITAGQQSESRFVKSYKIQIYNPYSPEGGRWEPYYETYGTEKGFDGNTNNVDKKSNRLNAEVYASMLRIIPTEYETGKSLRLEIKACPAGCKNIWLINGPQHSIADSSLSASTSYDANHGPQRSRLFTTNDGGMAGGWCTQTANQEQWIQADLGYPVSVKGISLQGRNDYPQWVKSYQIQYSYDGDSWRWVTWDGENTTTFYGDWSQDTLRTSWFPSAHLARYVRMRPIEWNNNICMRWDIQGCPGPYSSNEVGCYADVQTDRDLPDAHLTQISGGMTREACVYHCHSLGYLYAGMQFGIECWCGNSYGRYGASSQCRTTCDGDPGQICGGHNCNSVFTTGLSPASSRCADGWEEYQGSCYWFEVKTGETGFSWETGQAGCRQRGGDLSSINSQAENDFVMSRMAEYEENAWIGLHAKAQTYQFEWSNYDAVDFTNWARREPNNIGGEEDCVNIYFFDGTWNDDACTSNVYGAYVCESGKDSYPPASSPAPDQGCGAGWSPYRWKCYQILTNKVNWDTQKANCEGWGEGVSLARIKDSQEQAFLASKIAGYDYMFYTDVNDKDTPGTYRFTDGSSPPVSYWASGRPNSPNDPTGVALSGNENGLWYDFPVGDVHGAICEKLSTTVTQGPTEPVTPGGGGCPTGWEENNNYCYLIKYEVQAYRLTWDDANYYCTSRGADLASIHNQDENDFLWKFHIMDGSANYWTGLYRAANNESFKWSDGASGVDYLPWDQDFPKSGTSANCVQIMAESGKWRNQACDGMKSWICKIPAGIPLSTIMTEAPPSAGPDGSCAPDDDNWKYYNERCYYFGTDAKSWYDAGTFCNQNGGHLASIHNLDTNRFIEGQVRGHNSWQVWIGLNDIDGSESWSDGSPLDFTHYAEGQPDDSGSKLCAGIGSNSENSGMWIHDHCSKWFHFVCAKTKGGTTVTTPQPTPMPGGCPENYIAYRDKCIGLYNEAITWQEARDKCYEMHKPYSLVSISNRYEQAYLTALLKNNFHEYWIGLRFDTSASTFYWTDNTQIKYTNWAPNEPSGGDGEQCVHMYPDERKAGMWNDLNCDNTKHYICMTLKDPSLGDPPPLSYCPEYGQNSEDYVLYDEDCYKGATGDLRTWKEADDHCRGDEAEYGRLTSVMNVYEQAFLLSTYLDHKDGISSSSKLWIGLTDEGHEGRFVWSDDRTVIYTNWGPDQPNQPGGGCAYQEFSSGKWVDAPCSDTNYAICKISKKDKVYTRAPSGSCPGSERGRDWLEFGADCYMFIDEAKTFADARHDCQIMNAEVVSIHGMEENEFIDAHIQVMDFPHFWWLGFVRTISGSFQWTDDTAVNFLYWSEGEPSDNGTAGENCCEMYPHNGRWNDINCENANGYICKIPRDLTDPNPSTTPLISFPTDPVPSPTATVVTPLSTKAPTDPPTQPPQNTPSSTSPPFVENPDDGGSLSPGAGVGIAFAVIALVLLAAVVGLVIYRRQQWKKYASSLGGVENQVYGSGEVSDPVPDSDA